MQSNEKDGNYVRSIVAMMNSAPAPTSPPWVSPTKEATPPRTPPSYLSVSRSNSGYNNSLYYSIAHRSDGGKNQDGDSAINHFNGNGEALSENSTLRSDEVSSQYVSLSQMIAHKPNTTYSDLGLQLKGSEKNCRSFLRNISFFEMIGKQDSSIRSPEGPTVTMVGQKMQQMLHLEPQHPNVTGTENTTKVNPSLIQKDQVSSVMTSSGPEESVDVPDRALVENNPLTTQPVDSKSLAHRQLFSSSIFNIIGCVEPDESFDPPPMDLAGEHFRKIADNEKKRLLVIASLVDKQLELETEITEDVQGLMRSASGKANLIVRERFRQFNDLCEENICPKKGAMVPGPADLAGFWDMVMIEVNSIFATFRDLANAAGNNWTMPPKAPKVLAANTVRQPAKKSARPKTANPRRSTTGNTDQNKKVSRFRR